MKTRSYPKANNYFIKKLLALPRTPLLFGETPITKIATINIEQNKKIKLEFANYFGGRVAAKASPC